MGTGSLERSSGAAELPFSALRAVENDLGRLVAMLVAAEVRLPALLVSRKPDGLALNALAEQSDALGAHRPSLHTESWPCKSELCSPRNTVRLGSSASRANTRWWPSGFRPGLWPQGQSEQPTPLASGSAAPGGGLDRHVFEPSPHHPICMRNSLLSRY